MSVGRLPGGLPVATFLDAHWQKAPLCVRHALDAGEPALDAETVKRLASRDDIRSRLVRLPDASTSWTVRPGPFAPGELDDLPATGWTLLVQEADRHVPALASLLQRFRFAPNWRLDDVMVSLAPDGAGVGPHVDRYDVFLVQARGRRRWRVGGTPLTEPPTLLPGAGVRVLAEPRFDAEYVLEQGDMLYLPPRFAHDGVALGESITCSIGFRTPDPREFLADYLRGMSPAALEAIRYEDPDLAGAADPGEITDAQRQRLLERAVALFRSRTVFDRHVGRHVTRPLRHLPAAGPLPVHSATELVERLQSGWTLRRSAPPHFAWYRDREAVLLFVGGEDYPLPAKAEDVARLLCGIRPLNHATLRPHLGDPVVSGVLLDALIRGFLTLDPPA